MFFVGAQRAVTLFYAHLFGNPQGLQQGLVDPRMDRLSGSFLQNLVKKKETGGAVRQGPLAPTVASIVLFQVDMGCRAPPEFHTVQNLT
jgi:hypothetical protein